jgi:ribonuclease Z
MARAILLGVGTGVPDADRENTHLVWDGPGGPLLVDAGGSTYQRLLRAGLDPQALRGVILTHSHADHINGLPVLLFSLWLAGRREEPLPIWGLAPTLEIVRRLVDAIALEKIAAPVEWRTMEAGEDIPLDPAAGWRLRTAPTEHSRPCIALRWEEAATGRALVYSCDTAPCTSVEDLARNAEILIHEATTPGPFASHTSPREAGEIARRAGAKRLVLVHFSPRWTMPEEQALDEVRAGGFTGPAEIGREYQTLELSE